VNARTRTNTGLRPAASVLSPASPTVVPVDASDFEEQTHARLLDELADRPFVDIALDTEYQDAHTLSIQAAVRIGPDVVVQVYRSGDVPRLPQSLHLGDYLPAEKYGRFYRKIVRRPVRPITADLSPAKILLDLFGMTGLRRYSNQSGKEWLDVEDDHPFGPPDNAVRNDSRREWTVPVITVRLIAHFWTADLCHAFGSQFLTSLFDPNAAQGGQPLALHGRKNRLGIAASNGSFRAPTVEYVRDFSGNFYRIALEMRDTMLPFGPASLDRHCQTFLGLGKNQAISEAEKERMLETFKTKPAEVYGYGMVDAVNTLLLHEQMVEANTNIYRCFGFDAGVPAFQPTMGRRVARFVEEMVARSCTESQVLSMRRNLAKLLRQGGTQLFRDDPRASRYGVQTAGTHGGLLLNRSSTRFWHEAPGQLRDVDMSGCYSRKISRQNLYCGRPVIHEPGDNQWSLKQAVKWVERHAAPDAWLIRVTGDLAAGCNTLIPSTLDATTAAKLRTRKAGDGAHKRQGSKMFSARIESGIVTHATWAVIQAMPRAVRSQYAALAAESIVLYPNKLVAESGAQYDDLVERLHQGKLGFGSDVDFRKLLKTEVTHLDSAYVAMKFPIQDLARRFVELRQEAKEKSGKGSGMERAWKEQANTMYGVLASEHLPTQNFVAANIITATARANAWIMTMVLNGIQTITDGVTYRRDQIPACTFAECLRRCPDYPLRRPEQGEIPFLDPDQVPEDDKDFTRWLVERGKSFFQASNGGFAELVSLPVLEHKMTGTTGSAAFDALACDSSGNYLKCTRSSAGYKVQDVAMRGYGPKCRQPIVDWALATYQADRIRRLCPIIDDRILLKLEPARLAATRALRSGCRQVYLPLGLSTRRPRAYKAVKLSAFVFRTPAQLKTLTRQEERFSRRTGCGLELLCLRQKYRRADPPRLSELAAELYEYIQADGHDLTKKYNLNRISEKPMLIARKRMQKVDQRRHDAERELRLRIDARRLSPEVRKTGVYVTAGSHLLTGQK
jgi:hypothetical protein